MVEEVCGNSHSDKTSVAGASNCATAESYSERLSADESLSKPAKCSTPPETVQQKSSKELAKVKKREDKGIGKLQLIDCSSGTAAEVFFTVLAPSLRFTYVHCLSAMLWQPAIMLCC